MLKILEPTLIMKPRHLVCFLLAAILPAIAARAAESSASPAKDLQAQIDAAIRGGETQVTLPAGVLRLDAGLRIVNAVNLTINGPHTTLVFSKHDGMAFSFYRCRNLALRGFTIDYDPLPFTQGTITAKADDGSWCEFAVHEGYPALGEDYLVKHVHIFEAKQARWKTDAPDVYPRKVIALDPRRGRFEVSSRQRSLDNVRVGDRIVLNKRVGGAIRMDACENVRVEGLTILAAPGGGILPRYMRGDNRFTFDIRPGPPPKGATQPRLMSTCADAFNYAFARRGPVLRDCHFSFMGDDSVNLHGFTFLVAGVAGSTELLVGWPYAPESVAWVVEPGDPARHLKAGNYAIAAEAAIESFEPVRKPDPQLIERLDGFWPRKPKGNGTIFRLKLRAPLRPALGDAIDLPASAAPGFRISGCEFCDHRGRGTRIMSSEGVVESNRFVRLKMTGLSLGPEYAFWREAGWVQDVVVRGNQFEDCALSPDNYRPTAYSLGAISVFAKKEDPKSPQPLADGNRRIVIENNVIQGCAVAGIWVRCARDVTVRGNTIARVNQASAPDAGSAVGFDVREPIDVRGVASATVKDNHLRPNIASPDASRPAATKK